MKPEQPPIQEPSVLDFLKSRLKFWKQDERIAFPVEKKLDEKELEKVAGPVAEGPLPAAPAFTGVPVVDAVPLVDERPLDRPADVYPVPLQADTSAPQSEGEAIKKSAKPFGGWPLRSLLALSLALLAQYAWEPVPYRSVTFGLVLYILSAGLLVWAALAREWNLSPLPEGSSISRPVKVRLLPLVIAIMLSFLAFLTLGGNMFTELNVTLWVLAILFFMWAFWTRAVNPPKLWPRLKSFFGRSSWNVRITWGTLLVLLLAGVVVFFRIYNLRGVPSEPFSDHAEKILDVFDVSQGQTHIFFPRNTGREAIQMYLTLVVSWIFGTGLSFLSLKIGTVICGLVTLPYIYLLGKEYGGKRLGLLAAFFAGIAYWPNVISRVGLRFPLYPLFVAPTLYYLLRGFRRRNNNDFIIAGLFLGFGLHGYSPFRIVPFVVVAAFILYMLHKQSAGNRKQAIIWLTVVTIISVIVFLPLARYWTDNPSQFSERAFSRITGSENPLQGPAWKIFLSNSWNSMKMFNWDNGQIWVHSVPYRPALDWVSGALFLIGIALLLIRYLRQRHWQDLFLLLAVPLLQLPSTLSLAYPTENPALNRAGGALVPVFIIVAVALDGLVASITSRMSRRPAAALSWAVVLVLGLTSTFQNYDLVFNQYATEYSQGSWNTSEMGTVIKQFSQTFGSSDNVWIVPYAFWVDTRLPGVWAGIPNRDFALWPQDFSTTLKIQGTKLIMLDVDDTADVDALKQLYPHGVLSTFHSATNIEGKNFFLFFIPPED